MTDDKPRKIQSWPVEKLIPYEKNAKLHEKDHIEKLCKSIREFKMINPIVVDKNGVIIAGHGRRLAALEAVKQGDERFKRVNVVVRDDLTEDQVTAARLSDNRTVSAKYDTHMLQEELAYLDDVDYDLDVLGFEEKELKFLFDDLGEVDELALVDDVGAAVELHNAEKNERIRAVDEGDTAVGEALGFKRVTPSQARTIRAYVSSAEEATGLEGAEAVVKYMLEGISVG